MSAHSKGESSQQAAPSNSPQRQRLATSAVALAAAVAVLLGTVFLVKGFIDYSEPTAERWPAPPPPAGLTDAAFVDLPEPYHLADGEALKLVTVDDALRQQLFRNPPDFAMIRWDGRFRVYGRGSTGGKPTPMQLVLEAVLGLQRYDYSLAPELMELELAGDWVIRADADLAEKMRDFGVIVSRIHGRPVQLVLRPIEREVIVASGAFVPPAPGDEARPRSIQFHMGGMPPGVTSGTASGNVSALLMMMAWQLQMPVVEQLEPAPPERLRLKWEYSGDLSALPPDAQKEKIIRQVLDDVAEQTGLQFSIERREQMVWCADTPIARADQRTIGAEQ